MFSPQNSIVAFVLVLGFCFVGEAGPISGYYVRYCCKLDTELLLFFNFKLRVHASRHLLQCSFCFMFHANLSLLLFSV